MKIPILFRIITLFQKFNQSLLDLATDVFSNVLNYTQFELMQNLPPVPEVMSKINGLRDFFLQMVVENAQFQFM